MSDDETSVTGAIGGLIILGLILFGAAMFGEWRCGARWEGSGMRTSWGPVKGCMVETKPGRWFPEKVVREVP